jgi:2-oxoglutarate-Fe(II)-dependent oxygenase superfamily protein
MLAETVIAETVMGTVLGSGALATGGFYYAKSRRARLYRELASRIAHITRAHEPDLTAIASRSLPSFADRLAVVPDFLPPASFAALACEAERLAAPERSFVPTHKQGGTVAYETLIAAAPAIVACYHSAGLRDVVARLVGTPIRPTPIHDQSSLSVLVYNKPGDHIGWHYDHNFYRGRHFTVLLAIHNVGRAARGLSHAVLKARLPEREIEISTAANTLVVFEGARVRHMVTPIRDGERRLMLSMTYCTDPSSSWWQGGSRRLKDTAFFGLRALWT